MLQCGTPLIDAFMPLFTAPRKALVAALAGLRERHGSVERYLVEHGGMSPAVLQQLRDVGIELAIDDFGTGYSSLAYLRHLPVDCLKVDRSFVAEMAQGHPEIASAVIALAATLNLCTVAEGVETLEQAAELTALGASYLQGFSLAEPMTGGHAAAWFAAYEEDK